MPRQLEMEEEEPRGRLAAALAAKLILLTIPHLTSQNVRAKPSHTLGRPSWCWLDPSFQQGMAFNDVLNVQKCKSKCIC